MSDSFSPPASVRAAARRGLELRRKSGKGGLTNKEASSQGIGSGVQRARNLANGDSLSLSTVKRMKAFFDRHEKNKSVASGKKPEEDAGYVSWLLWGGDPGRSWANKIVDRHVEKAEKFKDRLPGGLADNKKPSDFDPGALADGREHELEHTSDPGIAAEIAMDHLSQHGDYYDVLEELELAWEDAASIIKAEGLDLADLIEKATKRLSTAQKAENKRKLNAKPAARAARAAYNREHGADKHLKAQYNYRRRHPERYQAQQKANTESSQRSHKCVVCGKPAKHKHHISYGANAKWEWLCHPHHVRRHHPKSNLSKSMATYKLSKAMAAGGQIPAASAAASGAYVSGVDGPVAKPKPARVRKAKAALYKFAKTLNSPSWSQMLSETPWFGQARALDAKFAKGGMSVDQYQRNREGIMITMMKHMAKAMPPSPELVVATPGELLSMDVGYGVPLIALSAVQALSSDDLGVYETLPISPRMRSFLTSSAASDQTGNPADIGAERSTMNKSDVFAEILGQDVGELRKAINKVERGENPGEIGSPKGTIPDGEGGEQELFDKEPKSGMPSEGGEGGSEEIWSADDTSKDQLGSKHSLVQATGSGSGSSGDTLDTNKVFRKGMVHYHTGEDEYIIKSMDEHGCITAEPSLGMPHTPLVSQHICSNDLCKSAYSQALSVCPDCGTSQGALHKGHRGVIIDRSVARALRPERIQDLYISPDKE